MNGPVGGSGYVLNSVHVHTAVLHLYLGTCSTALNLVRE
jgi:hypothetical protein